MSEPKLLANGFHLDFDGMCWPTAGDANADLEYALRYGTPTREQLLCAAGVLAAYRQMVYDGQAKRQRVIYMLRKYGDPANMADTRKQTTPAPVVKCERCGGRPLYRCRTCKKVYAHIHKYSDCDGGARCEGSPSDSVPCPDCQSK